MARYRGPQSKIARRFGEPIFGPDKYLEKKNYPPGCHGLNKRRKKTSEYGVQLMEKQKTKYIYGVLERQFRKIFHKALISKGVTGVVLLQLLESRLDNLVFRMGIAPSRAAARQIVTHRHIVVNGEICNIPSRLIIPGESIGIREKSKSLEVISNSLSGQSTSKFPWIEWDSEKMSGKLISIPERDQIPETVKEQLIVELYSK